MPRKTNSLIAEEARVREEAATRRATEEWPSRVKKVLESCTKEASFTFKFIEDKIVVHLTKSPNSDFTFPWSYSPNWEDHYPLRDLEDLLGSMELERKIQQEKLRLRESAKTKLTPEEWEALK